MAVATAPATRVPQPRQRQRRRTTELTVTDFGTMAGCAASSLAVSWLVFARLTEGVGWFGFLVVAYLLFVGLFALVTADRLGALAAADRVATVLITSGAMVMLFPLGWLIGYVLTRGAPLLELDFLFDDLAGVAPDDPVSKGGAGHAVLGSLEQVAMALTFTVPLAVTTAVFLNETRSRFRQPVRILVDAMSGLPSVLAGLFVYAIFIVPNAEKENALLGYNGFMASLALAIVMLPTITRTVDVVLRLVPDGLREASLALGATKARTVWSVVLPTARSGMTTAIILGIARAVGETAPLFFTSFGARLFNANPFAGTQDSLPLFVFSHIREPEANARDRGFTGAFVLLVVVLVLFAIARIIGRDRSGRRTRRRVADTAPAAATDLTDQEMYP